jgi:uncharacterized protein YegP (UPF0339 family)
MPTFSIDTAAGGYQAHFRADNGELVWWTEVYARKEAAQNAVDLLKQHAAAATVEDRTQSG